MNHEIDCPYLLADTSWMGLPSGTGGYILAPSHVFQPDTPTRNVLAVYATALGRAL